MTDRGRALRDARRDRLFAAMDAADLDVLVLGRRDDVSWAAGASALWTAGTRPFGAACVVVAEDRSVHLLSTWDAGLPEEIPFERCYGITWNPAIMGERLGRITGLASARRVGVDALSPGFARAAVRLAPEADVVAADDIVRDCRAIKLPAEVEAIRAALEVARAATSSVFHTIRSGASAETGCAVAVEVLASLGCTVPTSEPEVRRAGADGMVSVDIGVLRDGYEGTVARTTAIDDVGDEPLIADGHDALVAACVDGARGSAVRSAAPSTPWLVRGTGLGFDTPVISRDLGSDAVLRAGMVLTVETDDGSRRHRDTIVVAAADPDLL